MSLSSAASAPFRLSLWADSSSFPSLDIQDTPSTFQPSSVKSPRPSSSSSRSSVRETSIRSSRTFSRPSRQRRESIAPESAKRMSFIDFGESSSSGLFGALKGRVHRKRSAPLLGSSSSATTSRKPSLSSHLRPTENWSSFRTALDDTDVPLNINTNPMFSFKDERKQTLMPEEIINGLGYGIRKSRLSTVAESEPGEDMDCSSGGYQAFPFRKRAGIILHSYPRSEAPYMRSYNKVDLHNDAYFHLLLRRLNTTESPSFRDYLSPPDSVLDLGCGQGTWIQEAAAAWPNAKILGCDLVDLISDNVKSPSNVTFKGGNFVTYRLPFESGSFDLVRLSNLTEAIPQDRWEHVLVEVRRVLKPAGRVEIIDDEIMFPYPHLKTAPLGCRFSAGGCSHATHDSWISHQSHVSNEITSEPSNTSDSSFLDFGSMANRESVESAPSLCRGDSPSDESSDAIHTPTDGVHGLATLLETKKQSDTHESEHQSYPAPLSEEIESIYRRMLQDAYHINTRPGDFLESLLQKVFGPAGKTGTMKDFHLSLLSPEMHSLVVTTKRMDSSRRRSNKLLRCDRDAGKIDKNKEIMDKVIISQSKSKALRVLGADDSVPAWSPISTSTSEDSEVFDEQATAHPTTRDRPSSGISSLPFPTSSRPSSSASAASQSKDHQQPTGLFVFPDQFLEATPFELERYLCKHIDTLLSCKIALDDYVLSLRDENDKPVVEDDEWHDMLWEYERSRRERFNLPHAGGQFDDREDDEEDSLANLLKERVRHARTLIQPVATAINNETHLRDPCAFSESNHTSTLVRRIRVFEAYKIKPILPP